MTEEDIEKKAEEYALEYVCKNCGYRNRKKRSNKK